MVGKVDDAHTRAFLPVLLQNPFHAAASEAERLGKVFTGMPEDTRMALRCSEGSGGAALYRYSTTDSRQWSPEACLQGVLQHRQHSWEEAPWLPCAPLKRGGAKGLRITSPRRERRREGEGSSSGAVILITLLSALSASRKPRARGWPCAGLALACN